MPKLLETPTSLPVHDTAKFKSGVSYNFQSNSVSVNKGGDPFIGSAN
jgi:hypothetical protein